MLKKQNPFPTISSNRFIRYAIYSGLVFFHMPMQSAAEPPLIKSGTCPELKREPFTMGDDFYTRFTEDLNGDWLLKNNRGTIQTALDGQNSINCTQVPAGFKIEMWASEKTAAPIVNLQAFTFDERGRMWAVETFDYPNTVTDPFSGHDRIVILEDTDGDKVADKQTVFVDKLNIPQGIEITPQGVVIAMPPYLVLFEDKDANDIADIAQGKILYQGFNKANPGDTHGGIGSLKYGMDNWLYGESGYNGGTVKGVTLGPGIWRARMDGSKFEYFAPTASGNSFGMGFMEDGQVFASAANGMHSQQGVIPGVAANRLNTNENDEKIFPVTKDIVQGDWVGFFSAATDHEIYTARLFPQEYWNRAAFVSEGSGHLVNVDFLTPDKSSWKAVHRPATVNIFASTDAWSAPISTRVGPDGAIWVLDWYTYILLHNGINGAPYGGCPGGAWPNSLRTRSRERLYRVLPSTGAMDPILDLRNASYGQLVATFKNTNMLWRMMAQKLILRKAVSASEKALVEPLLIEASRNRSMDAMGLDGVALHAVWTAEGLGLFTTNPTVWDPILKGLLLHPSPAVRMNVAKAMPLTTASVAAIKVQGRVNDEDPFVRLWTLLALSQMPKIDGITLFTDFHNLDKWSQQAFAKAMSGAGIEDIANKPVIPPLDGFTASILASHGLKPLTLGPRFQLIGQGNLQVKSDWSLPSGTLTLLNVSGKVIERVYYDGKTGTASLGNLGAAVYFYRYRGTTGLDFHGTLVHHP
jgi:uncharacterized protein